jgi:hypothetical protein
MAHLLTASSPNSRTSLAQPESNAKSIITLFITSGLYRAHRSPADHAEWHRIGSLSPKPNSTSYCRAAQPAALRIPDLWRHISCPRRTTGASLWRLQNPKLPYHSRLLSRLAYLRLFPPAFVCSFFSKIDLVRAYNQISVHPDDI